MTTHKTALRIQEVQEQDRAVNDGAEVNSQEGPGFSPSPEQMSAYLYGLLAPSESAALERRINANPAFQEALQASRNEQALFSYWEDVPVPEGLVESTLERIRRAAKVS